MSEGPPGSPEFKIASLHTCHALKTPPDRPSLTKATLPCWLQHLLKPGHPGPTGYLAGEYFFRGCTKLQGGAASPVADMVLCVRFEPFVRLFV